MSYPMQGLGDPGKARSGVPGSEPSYCNCHECERLSAKSNVSGESAAQPRKKTGLCQDLRCSYEETLAPSAETRDYYQRRSPEGSACTGEGVHEWLSFSSFSSSEEQRVSSVATNIIALANDETNIKTIDSGQIGLNDTGDIGCSNLTLDGNNKRLNDVSEKGDHGINEMCTHFWLSLLSSEKAQAPPTCDDNLRSGHTNIDGVVRKKTKIIDYKSGTKSMPSKSQHIQPHMLVESERITSGNSSLTSTRLKHSRQPDQENVFESGYINISRVFQNNLDLDVSDQENDEGYIRNDRQTQSLSLNTQQSHALHSDTSNVEEPPSGDLSNLVEDATATQKTVLVTYCWNSNEDDAEFLEEVKRLCGVIESAGALIRIDMDTESFSRRRRNRLDWLDHQHSTADWILVCISPTYFADIQEDNTTANPRESQLNARYIFDKIRLDYHDNNSINRRTIPVLFFNFGTTRNHVPHCMSTTIPFQYPAHENEIVQAIFDNAITFRDE